LKNLSRDRIAGGLVVVLLAFGVANAAAAMFRAQPAAAPLALSSTQQIVEPSRPSTVLTVAER